ncbi:hypothetical protein [Nonomuraea sp. SBT364]|uniref:hypothetical protein n=1 Tax=Nonomuraea sp. SBT364 TaxID=1580530 RepID=UPI00066D1B92|nr:hypothetical protein [Nonomuraea sp. SBT364]
MGEQWRRIKVNTDLGPAQPGSEVSRDTIGGWLSQADPDAVERAGDNYVEAGKLLQGEAGVQSAIMKAAAELAEVWHGDDGSRAALGALRVLHASAGALGDAMQKTGGPMRAYAQHVREYQATVGALPATAEQNTGTGGTSSGGTGGSSGGTGGGSDGGTSGGGSSFNEGTGGGMTGDPSLNRNSFDPDEEARRLLAELNEKIKDVNSQITDGLVFELPEITPLEVDLRQQQPLNPGSGTETPSGTTVHWNGGDSGGNGGGNEGGGHGSSSGSGQGSSPDGSRGGDQPGGSPTTPQDPAGPGTGDPTSPGTGPDGEQGTGGPDTQTPGPGEEPGQRQDPSTPQGQNGDEQPAPPVIGGDPRTELAEAPTTPSPHATTTPNLLTHTPTTQVPTATANPIANPQGPGMWYGTSGSSATASPAVLRGGPAATGHGFMGFPPGGMAGGSNEGQERTREIYEPEGHVFAAAQEAGPDKLG